MTAQPQSREITPSATNRCRCEDVYPFAYRKPPSPKKALYDRSFLTTGLGSIVRNMIHGDHPPTGAE